MESDVLAIAIALAALVAAIVTVLHLSARRRWMRRVSDLEERLAGARAKLERAALTTQGDRQVVICWDRSDSKPALDGDFALVADVPERDAGS